MSTINNSSIGDLSKKLPQPGGKTGGDAPSSADHADAALFQRMFSGGNDASSAQASSVQAPSASYGVPPVAGAGASQPTMGDKILGGLASMSQHMQQKQEDLVAAMRRAVDSGDPMAMNDVVGKQNEFSLETQLTNKLVSRATQTIDQMSKQQ